MSLVLRDHAENSVHESFTVDRCRYSAAGGGGQALLIIVASILPASPGPSKQNLMLYFQTMWVRAVSQLRYPQQIHLQISFTSSWEAIFAPR